MIRQVMFLAVSFLSFIWLHPGQSSSKPKSPRGSQGKVERSRSRSTLRKQKSKKSFTTQLCSEGTKDFLDNLLKEHKDGPIYTQSKNILFNVGIDLEIDDVSHNLSFYQTLAQNLAHQANTKVAQVQLYTFLGHYYIDIRGASIISSQFQLDTHLYHTQKAVLKALASTKQCHLQANVRRLFSEMPNIASEDGVSVTRETIITQLLEAAQSS